MTLRLAQDPEWITCPTCNGKGKVPCPITMTVRTQTWGNKGYGPVRAPGDGKPIPCPECKGKKVVWLKTPTQ